MVNTAPTSSRRNSPLLVTALGLLCCAWLAYCGVRGWWTAQLRQQMGAGLLSMLIIGMALWALIAVATSLWLWRRSAAISRARFAALLSAVTLVGVGPPLLIAVWLIELTRWAARHG